ncbi:N-acetyl sugar amidotransferase [Sphingorhabdus buctiana]|uniref:N-acetyl sugar amidotransferase n=1 Tax=Sphingorhabdus buctiana TaxID=1508805 RepID=A0ABW4MBK5_9SPHN
MIITCTRCVMNSTVPGIFFDENGCCNYCIEHEEKVKLIPANKKDAEKRLKNLIDKIKSKKRGQYDCIIGLSGGVDSSYVAYIVTKLGLNPLAVHFDNGWNSELSIKNIENIVRNLKIDLVTYVIDWNEFRDIQKSFFKANVVDIEMITDHAIFAAMYKIANKNKIKYIISGTNAATESIMPDEWQHFKFDLLNLKSIHKKYGSLKIKNYPTVSIWNIAWQKYVKGIETVSILNYLKYNKNEAMNILSETIGWSYYGGKHYESSFTKFYQSYILPEKFNIDKRLIHLSDLIMNNEVDRSQALLELQKKPYDEIQIEADIEYVIKKLGMTKSEFSNYMSTKPKSHYDFPSYAKIAKKLVNIYKKNRYN